MKAKSVAPVRAAMKAMTTAAPVKAAMKAMSAKAASPVVVTVH